MNDVMQIDVDGARRLTERIRLTAVGVGEGIDKLKLLVTQAKESRAHIALGYASWQAYLADVLGETPLRLERDVRKELSAELSEQGMSTRAIAPIVGVAFKTVARDIESPVSNDTPARVDRFDRDVAEAEAATSPPITADQFTGEIIDAEIVEPKPARVIEGLDGKTYTATPMRTPQRKPLTDAARDIGWELRKATEKLQRLTEDDRFTRNKKEVAAHIRGHLMFTVESCQDLLDILNQSQED